MLWMSFYDPKKRGEDAFLGVVIAPVDDAAEAMHWAADNKLSPSNTSESWKLSDPVPKSYVGRLLTRKEVNDLNARMSD